MTGNTDVNTHRHLLESAGEQGLRVAGLRGSQGEGEGDLSLLVNVSCIGGSWPMTSGPCGGSRGPPLAGIPSPVVMPFSERNSSRSTYCRECCGEENWSEMKFGTKVRLKRYFCLLLWSRCRRVEFCPRDLARGKLLELRCCTRVRHRLFCLRPRVPLWIYLKLKFAIRTINKNIFQFSKPRWLTGQNASSKFSATI